MTKINIGLIGILIILLTLTLILIYIHSNQNQILDELEMIKASIGDLDYDIHEIEEILTKTNWIKMFIDLLIRKKNQFFLHGTGNVIVPLA